MSGVSKKIVINLITSKIFWESIPLIIKEISKREHFLYIYDQDSLPSNDILLNCDVLIDLSAIIDINFYLNLEAELKDREKNKKKLPLLVDSPSAVLNSMDKRKTHEIMPDLVPRSYNLDGVNNEDLIKNFLDNDLVVIKDPFGWQAKGIERLLAKDALKKFPKNKDLIVQQYIPWKDGVGRILTLNYKDNFEIMCAYLRVPNSWRTGHGTESEYIIVNIDDALYKFAKDVAKRSGLYLNGIDFILNEGRYILLEVNAAPGIRDPFDEFKIDTPKIFLDHIERSIKNSF